MAYNEETVQRIRTILHIKEADFSEKIMLSGFCFMVDDKMCCATHIDKKTGEEYMLFRVGESLIKQLSNGMTAYP